MFASRGPSIGVIGLGILALFAPGPLKLLGLAAFGMG